MIDAITVENFQSWKNLHFEFKDGVTLISGYNHDDQTPEGSGKSAILNALCWGLYGKLPKEAKIDEVIKEGEKSCKVQVHFKNDVHVHRYRGPNELALEQDGQIIRGKDARETQKIIETFLGMTFDTFCQTVYFAQNYNKKFVTSNQEERGKILSEIQDLSVFDRAYKEAHNLAKTDQKKVDDLRHQKELESVKFTHNQRSIEEHKRFAERELAKRNATINDLQAMKDKKLNEYNDLEIKIETFNDETPLIPQIQNDVSLLQVEAGKIQENIADIKVKLKNYSDIQYRQERLQNGIKFDKERLDKLNAETQEHINYVENPNKTCPTCGQEAGHLNVDKFTKMIDKNKKAMDDIIAGLNKMETELGSLEVMPSQSGLIDKRNVISAELTKINGIIIDLQNKVQNIQVATRNNEQQRSMLQVLKNDAMNIDQQIQSVQNQELDTRKNVIDVLESENIMITETLTSLESLMSAAEKRVGQLNTLKQGFKEVKSYTFNSVLNELSIRANNYLQELFEVQIKLQFTNEDMKIGLDIDIEGKNRSYGLFSGGQQRRIALAIDLALSDIVTARTGSSMNILILDEYFKDLSENSMTKCLYLLEKINKPTILIEHNSIFKSIVSRTFDVELKDGTSCTVSTV